MKTNKSSLKNISSVLIAISPFIAMAIGCTGTTIQTTQSTSPTDSDGGTRVGTGDGGTPSPTGDGTCNPGCSTGSVCSAGACVPLPATCPCPVESYCDLATNSCVPGCIDPSQCASTETCDTTTRTCKTVCTGASCNAQACPIPAAPAGVDGGAAVCNGVALQGAGAVPTCHTGAAPQASGGTITDGVWVLQSTDYYTTGTCPTDAFQSVWDMCGGTWALTQSNGTSYMMTPTISNATVSLSLTCPAAEAQALELSFDATPTTLTLYNADGAGGTYVDHYAKE